MSTGEQLRTEDGGEWGRGAPAKTFRMRALERRIGKPLEQAIVEGINETGGVNGASERLGVPPSTLRMWCWRLGVRIGSVVEARLTDNRAG